MDTNATMIPFYKEQVEKIEKEILLFAKNAIKSLIGMVILCIIRLSRAKKDLMNLYLM